MFKYIMRFFTYVKEECLCFKPIEPPYYPFSKTVEDYLPNPFSPLFAIQFIRQYADDNRITLSEAEIIFFLLSEDGYVPFSHVIEVVDHISACRVDRLLTRLYNRGMVSHIRYDDNKDRYTVTQKVKDDIRNYYKDWSI